MTCEKCGLQVEESAKFCMACGSPLSKKCDSCGTELPASAEFCKECGVPTSFIEPADIVVDIKCPRCGNDSPEGARFCGGCGSGFSVISETSDSRGWIPRLLHHLSPNDRTGRGAFFQTVVIIYGLYGLVTFDWRLFLHYWSVAYLFNGVLLALWVLVFALILFQVIKRFHDFDRPWWHVLTLLIPIWHLYEAFKLVFVRGDEGPNRFGEMTPQHGSTLRRNSWLLTGTLLVFVIGILWPLSFINDMLSLSESVTEAGEAHISIRENLVAGDCIVVAAPIETGLSDSVQPYRYELVWPWEVVPDPIDVVSCGGNWDYKVLDTLVVDRSGTYPEVNYFEQLAYDRCPSESELYLYPFPELWELGDRTINCLQNY